jgi:hypothetical protein
VFCVLVWLGGDSKCDYVMPWPEYTLPSLTMATLGVRMYQQLILSICGGIALAPGRCFVVALSGVCVAVLPPGTGPSCVSLFTYWMGGWRYSNLVDFCTFESSLVNVFHCLESFYTPTLAQSSLLP